MSGLVVVVSKSDTEFEKFLKLHEMAVLIGGPVGKAMLGMLQTQYAGVLSRVELDDADE